jgi:Domain of unknown function (DUF4145)
MLLSAGPVEAPSDLRIRCPACLHLVTLIAPISNGDINLHGPQGAGTVGQAGFRFCPNPECRAFIFVVYNAGTVLLTYPPERIDFDATNIPPRVLATLEEAISCHAANCYMAAGMMVRKTLEELCEDRGVTGSNLKARIAALGSTVLMPQELLDGLDDLRLLGNDAAHVEAKTYQQVGKEEVEVSLEFTKEVLKAVYQYSALLDRLRNLKRP